ncbi:YhcN/YlaJ family sporulation lipoprotein [Domibacillus sp. A3M-37]|uniref:YhcN/YlaJ family sporulation lipoprotein n=1 Tax=Domibacillus sp. A3M-37 TaxID=2962037 RepID=UPI0020B7E515|nr:YhcN/YlaJ family sporulation lipoprotein [Domibacillus sp. A3M-37]MCP3762374.1 YhcN/YlaJ family sporulation lipoprotein [Domibacillus sp. A3M-37]
MKKISILAAASLAIFSLMGCNNNQDEEATNKDNNNGAENVVHEENNDTNDTDLDNNDQTRFEAAEEAADRVAKLDEIDSANVIVADQTAYVAVVMSDGKNEEVTEDVENKIAEQVKSSDSAIQTVYVSANPDFVDQMKDYGQRIREGDPVGGLVDEFSDMVRRVFPDAH